MKFELTSMFEKQVHFIGIGGVSMSGLAAILLKNNIKVSGSDFKESDILTKLKKEGATIHIGHKKGYLDNVSLVVYTAAISPDNPEIIEAKEKNIKMMDRAEFLGFLMKNYTKNVAIAGTHGKTTTTSMLANVTLKGNLDPTILVGGDVDAIEGNFKIGNSEYFITEACEYKASFLKFNPFVGVILNIDEDHLDFYKDINHIENTFKEFAKKIPNDGCLIVCADDNRAASLIDNLNCNTITYGIENGEVKATNITYNKKGCATFTVEQNNIKLFEVTLGTTGRHNILNALAVISTALFLEIPKEFIIEGLYECKGAHKRFEYKGEFNNITIIDDYAHHPAEIKATLNTAKLIPHKKTLAVFQPHTYTRTKTLFNDFISCFEDADELVLMDIYAAREKDTGLVSSLELGDAIRAFGTKCTNVKSHEEAASYLKSISSPGDIILTVGAGDVVKIADILLKK